MTTTRRTPTLLALLVLGLLSITPAVASPRPEGGDSLPSVPRYGLPGVLAGPPVIPGCEAILTKETLSLLQLQTLDPELAFENWRQQHPHMIEAGPHIECQSRAWKALHPKKTAVQTFFEQLEAFPVPLAAAVGSNFDLAGGVQAYQGEVQLAINPSNPLQIVAGANSFYRDPTTTCLSPTGGSANTYGTQALYGSTDGGLTWVYRCAPWPASLTGGIAGAAAWFGSDPAVAWDASGNAFAVYMLIDQNSLGTSNGSSIVIAKSTDVGATWSSLGIIVNNIANAANFDDKEMVAIDRTVGQTYSHTNRIYVIWDENNVERVAYSDNGTTWTTKVISTSGDIGGNLAIGPDGTVYAVWNKYSQATVTATGQGDRTVFAKSTDGGANWTTATQIGPTHNLTSFGSNNKPPAQDNRGINVFAAIDVDTNPASAFYGRLYVAYNDYQPSSFATGSPMNIYVLMSSNGGSAWSSQVQVNTATGTATRFFPWLGVDQSDGTVNVSWYDSTVDATNNRKMQTSYGRSTDGGATFEPSILVTDNGANFRNAVATYDENTTENASRNPNQYGDYSGMAAANRQAHALWTDSRNYFPTADTVSPTRAEDVATVTITNCSAPSAISPPILACGANAINVSWTAPAAWGTNATGGTYEVDRFTDAACTQNKVVLATGLTATSYSDTSAVQGTTYYYEVVAKNNCPGTALTPMSVVTSCSGGLSCIYCTPPAVPVISSVTASQPNQITVTWGSVSGATSYNVYRSAGACPGSTFTPLANTTSTSWVDGTVTGGVAYSYRVTSVAACESAQSPCQSATATGICSTPPTFGGLTLATAGSAYASCAVSLAWSAGTSNCGGSVTYNVYRSTTSGFTPGASSRVASGVSGTSFTDSAGLSPSTQYYYVVRAVDTSSGLEDLNTVQRRATTSATCNTAAVDVQAFTVTSTGNVGATTGSNLLQWWNPASGPSGMTITVRYRTDGVPPTSSTDGTLLFSGRAITFGAVDSYAHSGIANGTTYGYTLFVKR